MNEEIEDTLFVITYSGRFPTMSARRLRNLIVEGFVPRYLRNDGATAFLLKALKDVLAGREFEQLLFIYTCRANAILADFVCEVYWNAYASGREMLPNEDARAFVTRANQDGKTSIPWSDSTIRRVAGYLTGCCADFGLLERGTKRVRRILPYRIEPRIAAILAYDLHLAGHGDNGVIAHPDWALFGMNRADVLDELKRLALKGPLIVQSAGGVTRIHWQYKNLEELNSVLALPWSPLVRRYFLLQIGESGLSGVTRWCILQVHAAFGNGVIPDLGCSLSFFWLYSETLSPPPLTLPPP